MNAPNVGNGRLLDASRANPNAYIASICAGSPMIPLKEPPISIVENWFWPIQAGEAQFASLNVPQRLAESGWFTVQGRKLKPLADSSEPTTVFSEFSSFV